MSSSSLPSRSKAHADVRRLPVRTKEQTLQRLAVFLQSMGNLSAYIENIGDDDKIVIKTFRLNTACATLPVPTAINTAVDQDRLATAQLSLEILCRALQQGDAVDYAQLEGDCLDGNGKPCRELSLEARKLAAQYHEPTLADGGTPLPRLTPAQIRRGIGSLLRRGADLAAYFVDNDDGMTASLRSVPPDNPLPPPSRAGHPVDKDAIGLLGIVLRQFNDALRKGQPPVFEAPRTPR